MAKSKSKKKQTGKAGSGSESGHLKLPVEVLGLVAKQLTADDAFGTCTALAMTSHALYDETLPTLCKKIVLWPAKAYADLPTIFWSSKDTERTLSGTEVDMKRKILKTWSRFKGSRGAAWTQFLVVPPFTVATTQAIRPSAQPKLRDLIPEFPRLKACVNILLPSNGTPSAFPLSVVGLASAYVYGSDDLWHLSQMLSQFSAAGGMHIRKNLTEMDGPQLRDYDTARPTTITVKELISRRNNVVIPQLPYRPFFLQVIRNEIDPYRSLDPLLLEALCLNERDKGGTDPARYLRILFADIQVALSCAKAFQIAVKAQPMYGMVALRFEIRPSSQVDITIASPDLQKIIAIIRGTYLLCCSRIPLNRMGISCVALVTSTVSCSAEIQVKPEEKAIETTLVTGASRQLVHRDLCGSTGRA